MEFKTIETKVKDFVDHLDNECGLAGRTGADKRALEEELISFIKKEFVKEEKDQAEYLRDECKKMGDPYGPGCAECRYSYEEAVCKASYEGSTLQWVPTSTKLKCRIGYPRIWNLEEDE